MTTTLKKLSEPVRNHLTEELEHLKHQMTYAAHVYNKQNFIIHWYGCQCVHSIKCLKEIGLLVSRNVIEFNKYKTGSTAT